jgi:restriction system protein
MSIPDFQSIMLPLLQHIADGKEHSNLDISRTMADHFQLSQEEQEQLLPSGSQKVFTNRVAWAKAHMKMAGLVESQRRGVSVITDRGLDLLKQEPEGIDIRLLKQFPEYLEKASPKNKKISESKSNDSTSSQTPQEVLEEAYQTLRQELSTELLSQIKAGSPSSFEQTVIDLLLAMGYGGTLQDAGQSLGKAGDEGLDGIIKEDRLGLDVIYVQAKKWENPVSRPEIQKFAGALQGKRARKGVFITTSSFSQGAREYAESIESKIVLISGQELAELMIDYGVGVTTASVYEVKRMDYDYFEDG